MELHEQLDEIHLVKIHNAFLAEETGELNKHQLADVLNSVANLTFDEIEFDLVFMRINTKRNGLVSWDEFISHLILGFNIKEATVVVESLEAPIQGAAVMLHSNHRHPVCKITLAPTVKKDRTYTYSDGNYLTASKDGVINYWSLDMQLERSVQSTSPEIKVQGTWVLDVVCLPDVSVVCTSSTERDLRFYDTSARKFELRVVFSSLEDAVCCMHYAFSKDVAEESMLIMGDMGGNVRILTFSPLDRGPFKGQPGVPLYQARYEQLSRGMVPGFEVIELKGLHTDWVRQVSVYSSLHSVISCAICPKAAMVIRDISESKTGYVYKISKGAMCFDFAENSHIVATGGSDCLVRIWNPFVPSKPSITFTGHHAGVVALILQDSGKKLASLSQDRCIKVWDVVAQTCLQTYLDLPAELGEHAALTVFYNPENRQILIGSVMIAMLRFCPLKSGEHTDGNTHNLGVSVVLYNPLFKVVLTCGLDSFIIVWDPWSGKRLSVVKNAHIRMLHGEALPVEITAGTFDPGNQLLLTGATDGSLKIWNFNTGTCTRNMSIEHGCEVTAVAWVKGRILAVGWNRHVMEFSEDGGAAGPGGSYGKSWDTRHKEDVLCAAVRVPQTLATSTYNGELMFWRLETGQPYKSFKVANPTERIRIDYKASRKVGGLKIGGATSTASRPRSGSTRMSRSGSISVKRRSTLAGMTPQIQPKLSGADAARARRVSMVAMPETCVPLRGLAVHCMIFLSAREMHPENGTLLVALENGTVQVWSHHAMGGFKTSFASIHSAGDYIVSMTTDNLNEFLFTGTTAGYVKTWLMKNYCTGVKEAVCMPKYRLLFPFLLKDRIEGRAKRSNRGQSLPILLNSYKAHSLAVSRLAYIQNSQILVSADCTCRLWTLGGRYLGTLGTFKSWVSLKPDTPPGEDHPKLICTDLRRTASSTTMKVWHARDWERKRTKKQQQDKEAERITEKINVKEIYGKRLTDPILGNYYKLPERTFKRHDFELDTSFAYIPVYQHLVTPPPVVMKRPTTPERIGSTRLRGSRRKILSGRSSKGSVKSKSSSTSTSKT